MRVNFYWRIWQEKDQRVSSESFSLQIFRQREDSSARRRGEKTVGSQIVGHAWVTRKHNSDTAR